MNTDLSVIVPIYNEGEDLWSMAKHLAVPLDKTIGKGRWQYVLVDNGSSDSTSQIVERICRHWPTSIKIFLDQPNYGKALKAGLAQAEGGWAYIINVDFSDPGFLRWAWKFRARYDLILGSKRADNTLNQQARYRRILSWGLNTILQFCFGFVGTDTHGQKLLCLSSMGPILKECVMSRGQFDTEFTLRAMRKGLWLAEVPVPIVEKRGQRNLMIKKIVQNIWDIFMLREVMKKVPFINSIRYHRWAYKDVEDCEIDNTNKTCQQVRDISDCNN